MRFIKELTINLCITSILKVMAMEKRKAEDLEELKDHF